MKPRTLILALAALSMAVPAAAQQQSRSYKFLTAVRESKGEEVVQMLDEPGQTIVNTRDVSNGEGALHIVVRRGDLTYLTFLLQRGADANMRDGHGDTPLMLAVQGSQIQMIDPLIFKGGNPNLANASGETPLIRAVQKRDLTAVRLLLAAGADSDQKDSLAGRSARDYAIGDPRATAVAKLIQETPKKVRRAVAGPKL